jgi:O-antigen/teichoic acid export membrane protein
MNFLKYYNHLLKHKRSVIIKNNIIKSLHVKVANILLEFYLISLILSYIGSLKFGIILLMFSFLNLFGILDFGIGNALRNKIGKSLAENKKKLIKKFISTCYALAALISIIFFLCYLSINPFLSWTKILSTEEISDKEIYFIPLIFFSGFTITFVIKLLNPILLAFQKSALRDMPEVIGKFFVVVLINILFKNNIGPSIITVSLIYVFVPITVTWLFSIYIFLYKFKNYKPSFKYIDFTIPKKIFKDSLNFFVIQISMIIMLSTDQIIITQLYGPEEVSVYHVAGKYYSIILAFFSMLLAPMWSAYTNAFLKKDLTWIKKTIEVQKKLFYLIIFICVIMFLISDFILDMWVGDVIYISTSLSISWIIFVIIRSYNIIYGSFLNGVNIIKMQTYTAIGISFLNIPLSIFLAKFVGLGPPGVILATAISFFIDSCIKKNQYNKIISNKATGIWNK